MIPDPVRALAALFDELAPTYDQVGIEFFAPIAARLTRLADPQPGERVVDLGCGRGALTVPLAEAVGPTGTVTAGDVSGAMVEAAGRATSHLSQVRVAELDATHPSLPVRSADLVAASCVIFFLPDPTAALRRWVDLLVPGGRVAVSTFGPQDEVWTSVDRLFDPYLPADMLDARTSGARGPFASDAGVATLFRTAGLDEIEVVTEPVTVAFSDASQWHRWTMSVGQRRMWRLVPESDHPLVLAQATMLLEEARGADGLIRLRQDVRYTIGRLLPLS